MPKVRQRSFEQIISDIDIDQFKQDFLVHMLSIEKLHTKYNICTSTVHKLLNYLQLSRNQHNVKSSSQIAANAKQYEELCDRITRDILYQYYIEEDHGYYETIQHFNITDWTFNRLLDTYGIKKDRSKSFKKGLDKRINTYGLGNETNWKKGHQTRAEHYGSVAASYRQGLETQKATMLERYGVARLCFKNIENIGKRTSKVNKKFAEKLARYGIVYESEFPVYDRVFDFKVGNILIEVNPYITHNTSFNPYNKKGNYEGISPNYHRDKSELAKKYGYRCIHVWDWDDCSKIISLLKHRPTTYARKCIVKEVPLSEAKKFLNDHHLQNYARCRIRLGLYLNDELISIMTFSKPRYNKKYDYELIRYASSYKVDGGAEKLFKYFVKHYNPTSVISYCDNSKFNGTVYGKLNFTKKSNGVATRHWYNGKNHYTDAFIRKLGFSQAIHKCSAVDDDLDTNDNIELMLKEGYYEIYDCGQSVYVWEESKC